MEMAKERGVKLIKGGREKKGSETVKCRENMDMNYSVVILSDSSLRRLSFFTFSFSKEVFFRCRRAARPVE